MWEFWKFVFQALKVNFASHLLFRFRVVSHQSGTRSTCSTKCVPSIPRKSCMSSASHLIPPNETTNGLPK